MQLQKVYNKPITRYTKNGDINIAYQVFGSGAIDLVYIPGWVSNIDSMWSCPELVNFLQELGKMTRVILFDKRGTGLSDRVVEFATLHERMDDIRTVMDAAGSQKAVLFGHSDGGSVSSLFAARYPNRTISLITFGMFAKRNYAPHYPWAPTSQEHELFYEKIENHWGSSKMNLKSLAPSKANDEVFMNWLYGYYRLGASPGAARLLTKMNTQIDIIDMLESIKVPTLVLQRTHDIEVKINEGRFIAKRIQGAKFIELEGSDHLFWIGNTDEILEEMKAFILHTRPKPVYEKKLHTIIVGHIVSSEGNNPKHEERIRGFVQNYQGTINRLHKKSFTAIFQGPSKAVDCSMALAESIKDLNAQLAMGIHIKECLVGNPIGNEIADFAAFIRKRFIPGQILLTQVVKNLLVGFEVHFTPYKTSFKAESGESFGLYTIQEKSKYEKLSGITDSKRFLRYDPFLEKVLQNIDNHLENENFCIEILCKEIGVSQRQLQRKLKAITNTSPIKLIRSMRLQRAKELILNQQDSIAEIAFKAGFSDPSYFSKCFKREFGCSPNHLYESV